PKAAPKRRAFVPAPLPAFNAWTGFPALPTQARAPMPLMRPQPQPQPQPATLPAPTGAPSSISRDLALVTQFARSLPFNLDEVTTLARKLETATTLKARLRLFMEHGTLMKILYDDTP
ncbi:hypothetical protein K1T71_007477, partial [Dendrolimus kikuchii]